MTKQHPITPPPELMQALLHGFHNGENLEATLARAFQAGADQELEACCAAVRPVYGKLKADWLRSVRRPKPPSLKEQALDAYSALRYGPDGDRNEVQDWNTVRRALEQLDD
jgi:hypothetical protein